jgi:ribonuclease HII
VAAASIIAKETREIELRKLHKEYGDFGSGYPSDPKTREWLINWKKKNKEWPRIVRTKWSTITSL